MSAHDRAVPRAADVGRRAARSPRANPRGGGGRLVRAHQHLVRRCAAAQHRPVTAEHALCFGQQLRDRIRVQPQHDALALMSSRSTTRPVLTLKRATCTWPRHCVMISSPFGRNRHSIPLTLCHTLRHALPAGTAVLPGRDHAGAAAAPSANMSATPSTPMTMDAVRFICASPAYTYRALAMPLYARLRDDAISGVHRSPAAWHGQRRAARPVARQHPHGCRRRHGLLPHLLRSSRHARMGLIVAVASSRAAERSRWPMDAGGPPVHGRRDMCAKWRDTPG